MHASFALTLRWGPSEAGLPGHCVDRETLLQLEDPEAPAHVPGAGGDLVQFRLGERVISFRQEPRAERCLKLFLTLLQGG